MSVTQHKRTINTLAALFKRNAERDTRPIFLLGAGASVTSGVPLAAKLVEFIARHAFAVQELGDENAYSRVTPSDWSRFLNAQSWFKPDIRLAENFPLAVQHLLCPPDFRRRFLKRHVQHHSISKGYQSLAQMMLRRLCCTVLTTNYDYLLRESLAEHRTHLREIVEINKARDDLDQFNSHHRCQVVYLHGSIDHYTDCTILDEVQQLNEKLAKCLWPMLAESPLIVIGYRGAEPSIVEHLLGGGIEESRRFRHGIYWCTRDGQYAKPVEVLREKLGSSFIPLTIDGFDELLLELNEALASEHRFIEEPAVVPAATGWDSQLVDGGTWEEIDEALLLSTLTTYCERLKLGEVRRSNVEPLLTDLQLAVKRNGSLVPTNGCLLLFGKNPQERFQHARVSFTSERKKQRIFNGNLIQQWDDLAALLQDESVNPMLRLKNISGGEERLAYPREAARELITNLLVHREYQISEFSQIEHEPGNFLRFRNPGGLPASIHKAVKMEADGTFSPESFQSECRNPVIADIFYGRFRMEKAGSGLPLVKKLMPEHGGRAEFRSLDDNQALDVCLLQAEQPSPNLNIASRRTETEIYTTNLLPFRSIPERIYRIPTLDPNLKRLIFESDEEKEFMPVCIVTGGWLISFADFHQTPKFAARHGNLKMLEDPFTTDFIKDEVSSRHFVWLLGQHWNLFLKRFAGDGLYDEWKRKRAFFHLLNGRANTIRYISRTGRNVSRDVVKSRGEDDKEHENEGFYYQIVHMSSDWSVMLKPTYVFTGPDGKAPLPPRFQTSRATRRFKYDRNPSVEADLAFWSKYLGKNGASVNLGRELGDDLILDLDFISVELPIVASPAPK